jgi:hypothetical protein
MEALLHRCGLDGNAEFVEPVVVDVVPHEFRHLSKGYLSLNLTVRDKVWRRAADLGIPYFIVMEDDIMELGKPEATLDRITTILSEVPPDWDMVYLEYCMEKCFRSRKVSSQLKTATEPYCTAAVIYRTKSIGKLRDCLDTKKRLIDFSYVSCIADGALHAYVASPPLFAQDAYYDGDLAHLSSPQHIQYWLNWIIRMYPDVDEGVDDRRKHYPRLPACISFADLYRYVRWRNVVIALLILVASSLVLRHVLQNPKK